MTHAVSVRPDGPERGPPFVLVHGAASSAGIWTHWQRALAERGYASYAIDLRGHGAREPIDLSHTGMADYADDVRELVTGLDRTPVVMGWSMGGLVAMMVAARGDAAACVALAPSVPSRARDASIELRTGEFGPDEYGITSLDPEPENRAMPDLDRGERTIALAALGRESRYARDDRKAGIVIETLPCPLLIVTGSEDTQWPRKRYDGLWLDADYAGIEGASHWGLVLSRRALDAVVPKVVDWVAERA